MVDVSDPAPRSYARLTVDHLARLSDLAAADHAYFTRADGRPEYRDRKLVVVLAQGAALHFVDRRTGIKDLDVWTFYGGLDGERFPGDKRARPLRLSREPSCARRLEERVATDSPWPEMERHGAVVSARGYQADLEGQLMPA